MSHQVPRPCAFLFLVLVVSLVVVGGASAQSFPKRGEPVIPLLPAAVESSTTFPPSTDGKHSYEAAHLLDGKGETAWFPTREDASPWVLFTFDHPVVVQALAVINGWAIDHGNWSGNSRARTVEFELDDGSTYRHVMQDTDQMQYVPGLHKPTRTLRLRHVDSYPGKWPETGMSSVRFFGRFHDEKPFVLKDLATCRVTFLEDLRIPANSAVSDAFGKSEAVGFFEEGLTPEENDWNTYQVRLRVRAPRTSDRDRFIRAGRSFEVVNVVNHTDKALVLTCGDGTEIGMETRVYGSILGPFGALSVDEFGSLWGGRLVIENAAARTVEDY